MSLYIGKNKVSKVVLGSTGTTGGGGVLQMKNCTPTEETQTISPDSGYYGLSKVNVAAISSTYIGSGIQVNNNSGNVSLNSTTTTQTFPSGYYPNQHGVTVSTTTHENPTLSIDDTTGVVTATHVQTSGYVSGDTTTDTLELTTVSGNVYSPTESVQTIVSGGTYVTGDIKVSAISSTYVGSGVAKLGATTYTPRTTNQTIGAGRYLTGNQTIVGDSNLVASNIRSGITIFNVTGTYEGNSSGSDYSDATATTGDILYGKTAYAGTGIITGTIQTKNSGNVSIVGNIVNIPSGYYSSDVNKVISTISHEKPTIFIGSDGVITATHVQDAGYIMSNDTKTETFSMSTIGATTYTPSTSNQTIPAERYTTGVQTILGDSSLRASNIKSGVTIFGVTGSFVGTATGGIDTSDATADENKILSGYTAYVDGTKVTGNIPTKTSENVSITSNVVNIPSGYYSSDVSYSMPYVQTPTPTLGISSTGVVTAIATQGAGYSIGGTKTGTLELPTIGATTYTPGTTNQTISSGRYTTGDQTILGDVNLVASNIKSGVTIFGVSGSYVPTYSGLDTSDATATASDILSTKTAYVNGVKITGNIATVTQSMVTSCNSSTSHSSGSIPTYTFSLPTGYYPSGLTKTFTPNLTTQGATTYTPTTVNQSISRDIYLTGIQTILGDANLVAGNIKSGVSIFGVEGTYVGEGGGSSRTITIKTWTN